MKIKSAHFVKGIVDDDEVLRDKYPHIAFVGRSNVGKSSVINSLVGSGKGLVKTGKKPGKTTEINFFKVNDKYYFVDLPGYGFAVGGLEGREKIRTMIIEYLTHADMQPRRVVLVLDGKVGLTDFDRDMLDILRGNNHEVLVVLNKIDKLNQSELAKQLAAIRYEVPDFEIFPYSALAEKRVKELREKVIA